MGCIIWPPVIAVLVFCIALIIYVTIWCVKNAKDWEELEDEECEIECQDNTDGYDTSEITAVVVIRKEEDVNRRLRDQQDAAAINANTTINIL